MARFAFTAITQDGRTYRIVAVFENQPNYYETRIPFRGDAASAEQIAAALNAELGLSKGTAHQIIWSSVSPPKRSRRKPGAGGRALGDLGSILVNRSNLIIALQRDDPVSAAKALQSFLHQLSRYDSPARELQLWPDEYKKFLNAVMGGDLETARQIWGVDLLPMPAGIQQLQGVLDHIRNVLSYTSSSALSTRWAELHHVCVQQGYAQGSAMANWLAAADASQAYVLTADFTAKDRANILSLADLLEEAIIGADKCAPASPDLENLQHIREIMICVTCGSWSATKTSVIAGQSLRPRWRVLADMLFTFGGCSQITHQHMLAVSDEFALGKTVKCP